MLYTAEQTAQVQQVYDALCMELAIFHCGTSVYAKVIMNKV